MKIVTVWLAMFFGIAGFIADLLLAPHIGQAQSPPPASAQSFSPAIEGVAIVEIWTTATGQSEQVGSGVAIDLVGDILTAKHVLKGFNEANQSIYVRFNARSGNPIPVLSHNCARGDPDKDGADICVLKIGETDLKNTARVLSVQPISCRKLSLNEKITGSGWPKQFSWEQVDGQITQPTLIGYLTTASFLRGMSGGPFYDEKGEIVGLINHGVEKVRTLLAPLFRAKSLIDDTGNLCPGNEPLVFPGHYYAHVISCGDQSGTAASITDFLRSFKALEVVPPWITDIKDSAIGDHTAVYYKGKENYDLAFRLAGELASRWHMTFKVKESDQPDRPTPGHRNFTPPNAIIVQVIGPKCVPPRNH